jgi:hypothetical protein
VAGTWSRAQAKARDRITGQHGAGDFVFFSTYTLVGLVSPLSSFFLTLLEFFGFQLQHLSPNTITLVAVFAHLCEMFMGVRPSVQLFWRFFIVKVVSQHPPLIGGYYFQCWTQGPSRYIAHVFLGRWEHRRYDWALALKGADDRLALPAIAMTLDHAE